VAYGDGNARSYTFAGSEDVARTYETPAIA
jgi:hypothetical protein